MKRYWRKVVIIAALISLSVLAPACSTGQGGNQSISPTAQSTPSAAARTINGKVSYAGTAKHQIIIIANRTGEQTPAYSVILREPGPYTIGNVTDATYLVSAFMDLGDDMGPPGANEPKGSYDSNGDGKNDQVIMQDGKGLTGIDITLVEPK